MSPHFFNNSMFVLFIPSKCFKLNNFPQQHNNKTNKNQRSRKLRNHKSNECRAWELETKLQKAEEEDVADDKEKYTAKSMSVVRLMYVINSFHLLGICSTKAWHGRLKLSRNLAQITPYLGWWSVRFTIHPTVLASLHRSEKTYEQWFFNGVAQKHTLDFGLPSNFRVLALVGSQSNVWNAYSWCKQTIWFESSMWNSHQAKSGQLKCWRQFSAKIRCKHWNLLYVRACIQSVVLVPILR